MTPLSKPAGAQSSAQLSLKEVVAPVLPYLEKVEDRLNSIGQESEGILKEGSRYVLSGGGKRLRAALVLFCASISENSANGKQKSHMDAAVEVAAAVELIHSATLVHDDIIDRAVLRRLKPTVNVQFGEEVAVLLGDFLYARAFEMIAGVGNRDVTVWMAETTRKMCEGELDQLKHRYRSDLALEEYISFIERKTATLIAASARSGARLAGLPQVQEDALSTFGLSIGIAFQIVDDLLDVVGSENRIGKTLHTDVGNGKLTLPMIFLLGDLTGAEKKTWSDRLASPSLSSKDLDPLIRKHRLAERTEEFANEYFRRALDAISVFGPETRIPLEKLSRFILFRDY